jgi:aspartate aminotransferase-like enzyme
MGYVDPFEAIAAISAIGLTLKSLGKDVDYSGAVTAALHEVSK